MADVPQVEAKLKNISDVKLQLSNIIRNIEKLEHAEEHGSQLRPREVHRVCTQTDALLKRVEKVRIQKIVKAIQKRKKKRLRRKFQKLQSKIKTKDEGEEETTRTPTSSIIRPTKQTRTIATFEVPRPAKVKQQPHQRLLRYHDAQRFLRTFELLKMLHYARTQKLKKTQRFAAHFDNMRATWNTVLQQNASQRTQERRIEDQWNEVLFGASEQTYYGAEQKISEFLRIRRTWDSYLTRSKKRGSSIPTGWVLPKETAYEQWSQYKCK